MTNDDEEPELETYEIDGSQWWDDGDVIFTLDPDCEDEDDERRPD